MHLMTAEGARENGGPERSGEVEASLPRDMRPRREPLRRVTSSSGSVSQLVKQFGGRANLGSSSTSGLRTGTWASTLDINKASLMWLEQSSLTLHALSQTLVLANSCSSNRETVAREALLHADIWARKLYSISAVLFEPEFRTLSGFLHLIRSVWTTAPSAGPTTAPSNAPA